MTNANKQDLPGWIDDDRLWFEDTQEAEYVGGKKNWKITVRFGRTIATLRKTARGDVIVPDRVMVKGEWRRVTAIGGRLTQGNTLVTSVSGGKWVWEIFGCAFLGCPKLTRVSLPEAKTFGRSAFYNCSALTSVSLPEARVLNEHAFAGCSALTAISLPKAQFLGTRAFCGCSSLADVSIPRVRAIDEDAFLECPSLESVTLGSPFSFAASKLKFPKTLRKIIVPRAAGDAWNKWAERTNKYGYAVAVELTDANADFRWFEDSQSWEFVGDVENWTVELEDGNAIVAVKDSAFGDIIIPDRVEVGGAWHKVTAIGVAMEGDYTVAQLHRIPLTGVRGGKWVRSVGMGAFAHIEDLQRVSIPNAESVSIAAFMRCEELYSVDFPRAKIIGSDAFAYCSGLRFVEIPCAERICDGAFRECIELGCLGVPSVREIEKEAFSGSNSLAVFRFGEFFPLDPDLVKIRSGSEIYINVPRRTCADWNDWARKANARGFDITIEAMGRTG